MVKKKENYYVIKGEKAQMTDKDARHTTNLFKAKHKKGKNGKVIIELTPATKEEKLREGLITELAKKLEGSINREDLMRDILNDVRLPDLEMMDKALKRGATVKAKEGCYHLSIKDPRRKKAFGLNIRK